MSSSPQSAPLLSVHISQTHQVRIDRRLAVLADGSGWCWTLASVDPETSGRVGTFRFPLDSADFSRAVSLATTLSRLPSGSVTGPRELPQVTIRAGDRAHGYSPGAVVDPAVSEVYFLAERLMATGAQSPLSALELAVRPQPGWPSVGQAGQFALLFSAPGTERVRFTLDADSFSLRSDDWAFRPTEWPRVGLLAAGGRHVDGIYAQAELGPGETAALVLAGAPPFTGSGPVRIGVRVEGTIVLLGPDVRPSVVGERFRLSRLIEGEIGPA